jgi:hypothetical protein
MRATLWHMGSNTTAGLSTKSFFQAIAQDLGLRPSTKTGSRHLDCGLTDEKDASFQIKHRGTYLEIGLAFDSDDRDLNRTASQWYIDVLAPEIKSGTVFVQIEHVVFIMERLPVDDGGLSSPLAKQAAQRMKQWKDRFQDRAEPADLD